MATPRVTIPELPEQTELTDSDLLIVQNGADTKKMSISTVAGPPRTALAAHVDGASDVHDASAISATANPVPMTGTNVQLQLSQAASGLAGASAGTSVVQANLDAHLSDTTAHTAAAIPVTPTGNLAANNVQSGLVELQTSVDGVEASVATKAEKSVTIATNAPLSGGGDLSASRTLDIATFTTTTRGVVPAPGTANGRYLDDTGNWTAPAGGGPGGGTGVAGDAGAGALVRNQPEPSFVTRDPGNPVWDAARSVFGSVYWPYVVRVGHLPISPLDEYYMYISTDHNYGQGGVPDGGVELCSAPNLNGPWTSRGLIYADPGAGDSIETASVIWNEQTSKFHMFHQRYDAHTDGGQATCLTMSSDGRTGWSPYQVVLDAPPGWRPGGQPNTLHTGYFRPFRFGNWWAGYSLTVAGQSRFMISYSVDGIRWQSDPRQLPKTPDAGAPGWVNTTPFRWQGELWAAWSVPQSLLPTQIFMGKISPDFRHVLGPPIAVLTVIPAETNPNGAPIRTLQAFVDKATLHLFYKAGGTNDYDGQIYHAWINPEDLP